MSQPDLSAQASQGDPTAMAKLLRQALAAQRVDVRVTGQAPQLQITLESNQRLDQTQMVPLLRHTIEQMGILPPVETVDIICRRNERVTVDWRDRITLSPPPTPEESPGEAETALADNLLLTPDDHALLADLPVVAEADDVPPLDPRSPGSDSDFLNDFSDFSGLESDLPDPQALPLTPEGSWLEAPTDADTETENRSGESRADQSPESSPYLTDNTLAALAHLAPLASYLMFGAGWLSGFLMAGSGSFLVPWRLVAPITLMLTRGNQSPYLYQQAKEALNFQLTMVIVWVVTIALMFILIGFLLVPLVALFEVISVIAAAGHAAEGRPFRYPLCLRLVR